jgi:hypothetical protein
MKDPKRPRPSQTDQADDDTEEAWEPYAHADGRWESEDPTDW